MRNFTTILSLLLLGSVGFLFYLHYSHSRQVSSLAAELHANDTSKNKPIRIAYVDLDTIDAKFQFYKEKWEVFEKKKEGIDRQLNGAYQQLDDKRVTFLKKGNDITQIEAESFKRDYDQQLQYLEGQRRKMEQDVSQEAMVLRDEIFKKINDYLTIYSRENGYTYVFSYSRNANVFLYQDPVFNITNEVIDGLNKMYKRTEEKK